MTLHEEIFMFKFILSVAIAFTAFGVNAQHYHRHHRHHHGYNWVAPVIIGGVVGYAIANNVRAEPPPVMYIEQQPIYTCPYNTQPIFNRTYIIDRYGRSIPNNQFVGCQ